MNKENVSASSNNQEEIQIRGPIESRRILLERVGKKDGLSVKSALRFVKKHNLWFGISEDVVDVLIQNDELGYVKYDPEKKRYLLIQPNPNYQPK